MTVETTAKESAPKSGSVAAATAQAESAQLGAEETTREQRALAIMRSYVYGNAAASFIPVPVLDLVAVTGVQLAMVRKIAQVYDVPFRQEAAKEVVTTLLSGLGARVFGLGAAYSLAKLLPGIGTALGAVALPLLTGAITHAVGKVFILHFETGGTLLDLNPAKMRDYFQTTFQEEFAKAKQQAGA